MISNGVLLNVYNIEHFCDLNRYYDEVEALIAHVKSSRLAEGFKEILAPGEPEFRSAHRREKEGITIDDTTWSAIREEAQLLGVRPDDWSVPTS